MWAHSLYPRLNLRDFSKRVVKVCGQRQCKVRLLISRVTFELTKLIDTNVEKETLNVWREELVQHKSIDNMQGELSGITIEGNMMATNWILAKVDLINMNHCRQRRIWWRGRVWRYLGGKISLFSANVKTTIIWHIFQRPAEPFAPTHISPEPDSARQSGNNDEHQAGSLTEEQKRRIEENRLKALAKRRVQTTDQQNQEGMLWDPLEDLQEQQEQQDEEYVDPAEEYI